MSTPFSRGSRKYTDIMKTDALKEALDHYQFDAAFGGARRDEEKSRAKERVYSFRDPKHTWDPKNQRPELWKIYNGNIDPWRKYSSISTFELDRTRHLAVYIFGELANRSPLLCPQTPCCRKK